MKTKAYTAASSSCRQLRCRGAWRRISLALLLMMLTSMTAWADDVNLSEDPDITVGTAGHYYVNMPATGTNTLTITAQDIADGKGTFKVYDDGGKNGRYSNGCNGILVLKAPTGYLFQLSGSVTTDGANDNLTVYNGSTTSSPKLIDAVSGSNQNINTSSIGNFMTLNFTTNAVYDGVGFDLTVTLVVAPTTDYNVTINTADGGSVTATPTSAKINEDVTLTATPGNEYMLSGISVKDADNNDVVVTWDGMFINTATFTMPGSDVTVTPTFTNDLTNLSVNMPKTGEKDVIIPSYVQSFKVYDDGGKDGNYSQNCTGTLVLTAPEGYVLQLSGSVTLDYNNEKLTVYNGTKANDDKLIDAFSCSKSDTKTDIPMATSKGNVMTIYFETNNFYEYAGLDLTVTVVSASTDYTINGLGPATGGSISASVGGENATTAKANDVVTLTATPESNYLFNGISVKDASNNVIAVTWDGMFNNTATFTMPGSNVTVTPMFSDNLTNLSVNMPKTGSKSVTIPSYVQSIKVYDDGGSGSAYSPSCDGTLVLTAPTGYLLQLSGSISSEKYHDMLTVYDNSEASGTKLIDEVTSPSGSETAVIYPVFSSGNVMTLKFVSDSGWNYDGFDLTVTIVNPNTEYNVNVVNPAEGGSVTASPTSAKVNETVTLTATPDNKYLPNGFNVKDANNNAVAVTWDGPFSNTATFIMPGSKVTVTPTFSDDLTNLSVNMPKTVSKSITIPSGVQSFKVYDDGGSSSDYSTSCNGTLVLTAPTGYVLQLSGGITTESSDKLTVYNGGTTNSTKLIDALGGSGSTKKDIEPVTSSSNVMMINFKSDYSMNYAGLDLTVTLIYNLNETDGITSDIATQIAGKPAQFIRTGITANAYSTVCLPFDFTTPTGCTIYGFQGIHYDEDALDGQGAWVADIAETTEMKAHTPYIFKSTGTEATFSGTASDAADYSSALGTNAVSATVGSDKAWTFKGTYSAIDWSSADPTEPTYGFSTYVPEATIAAGTFVRFVKGASLAPFRARLIYSGTDTNLSASTRGAADELPQYIIVRIVNAGGTPTAIGTLDTHTGEISTDSWFDLNGRRLSGKPAKKGMYIHNGKVVMK